MRDVLLIFDFDDTIVATNEEFYRTNLVMSRFVSEVLFGNQRKVPDILAYQSEVDIKLLRSLGLARPRFLLSWFDTYDYFCRQAGKLPRNSIRKQIESIVNDIYIRQFENIPAAIPTLQLLKNQGYPIVILTAGEVNIQQRRIQLSGAQELVDDVLIYAHKTPDTLKEVMVNHPAREYVMIGNSLKTDIYPALTNNIWGFHFERKTWAADYYEIDTTHEKYVKITSLSDIPDQLKVIMDFAIV